MVLPRRYAGPLIHVIPTLRRVVKGCRDMRRQRKGGLGVVVVCQWLHVLRVLPLRHGYVTRKTPRFWHVCFSSPPLQLWFWVDNIFGPLRFLSVHIVIVPSFRGGIQHCFPFCPLLAIKKRSATNPPGIHNQKSDTRNQRGRRTENTKIATGTHCGGWHIAFVVPLAFARLAIDAVVPEDVVQKNTTLKNKEIELNEPSQVGASVLGSPTAFHLSDHIPFRRFVVRSLPLQGGERGERGKRRGRDLLCFRRGFLPVVFSLVFSLVFVFVLAGLCGRKVKDLPKTQCHGIQR